MKNEYVYTKEIIEEYEKAWWNNHFKKLKICVLLSIILGIIILIYGIFNHMISSLGIALIVFPFTLIILLYLKRKQATKLEIKRYNVLYGSIKNGSIKKTMVIELDEEIKCSLDNENKRNISYDKVKGFIETDNLIVLLFDGNLLLPLKKDSFTVGNYEECKKFLLKKINK